MRNINSVKEEFLKKWIWGLRKYSSQKKNMSLMERKKAIKLSADLAMASTRNKTTRWSRALIANASRDGNNNKVLAEHVTSSPQRPVAGKSFTARIRSCRNMLRRNRAVHSRAKDRVVASSVAKRLVQKRTRRLKSLLPGGESMDGVSLVEETLDYIQSLRAQVEVMRSLVTASEIKILNPSGGEKQALPYIR
ncbi:hypothetical protein GLYMA_17G068800v4 [Glycine max]|uniref:IBH1-like N-terminal domain-containing protein n=4 Tax=Glycine subgen. Soja TaxID=1462606 RepID=K7MKA0_SOYBN|nr:transcription factor IBH1-like 1 [Glycine max]XP_028208905.1 transcription factor IBH1-like 1 [Glycine soja]KAG4929729.1 hypothetical protein JHK86_046690 [Glycine max]KAG4932483.1 hypothetical protein JHK87_046485 [Glycine soja]KAH1117181.1 hypothetical protein GYH30_046493 [Glycine max]KAH1201371.1 Transcription factor IBH1-like 1 [Glycine max]KRH02953.1 hypothetical protein GLYMA_17G068800v4 [Glycine max]|eukprot:XP_003549513.2 transcription factor IBH1-like 1 [Glycine max]